MTAVEWLIEQYVNKGYIGIQDELQAKEMEKQQITKAYQKGYDDVDVYEPEKYYNENYKK